MLIGNSNYKYSGKLDNPINDVRAIKTVLEQLGFTVLKYEDCSQDTMKRAIDKFGRQLKTKDVGLFFYAGHGVQVDGYNYLLPIDAKLENENDAEYDCIRAPRILAKMESAASRTNIVILDACRANLFQKSWRRGGKRSGLAFMNAPSGSLIAYSTAPGKTAFDGRGTNSPYTQAILQYIDVPNITIIQMFQKVRETVMIQSDKKQIPWESTSLRGDFYFRGGRGIRFENDSIPTTSINHKSNPRLFINTKPKDSTVRILNIKPRFFQGIELNLGHYHIEVSRSGYETKRMWLSLRDNDTKTLNLQLNKSTIKQISSTPQVKIKTAKIDKEQFSNDAMVYFDRGKEYYKNQQYTKAIQDFTHAIDLNPNFIEAHNYRGFTYLHHQEYIKAIQDFTKAIDLQPIAPKSYFSRGSTYNRLKQYTEAIRDFTQAIHLDTNYVEAYDSRALTYVTIGEYTRAIQDYTKAIDLNPLSAKAYRNLGLVYFQLDREGEGCFNFKKSCDLGDCEVLEKLKKADKCN